MIIFRKADLCAASEMWSVIVFITSNYMPAAENSTPERTYIGNRI